jgi:hypothetical protein
MVLYSCDCCNYSSKLKGDYKRHLKTSKHIENIKTSHHNPQNIPNDPKKSSFDPQMIQFDPANDPVDKNLNCGFCDTSFTFFTNKRRHELHRCKNNPNVVNSIISEKNKTIETIENDKKQLYKQIELLLTKVGNTTTNIVNTQNIQLNNYGNEDLTHITDKFKESLIKIPYGMIPKLIEAIHFNDKVPANKNIIFPNKKENKIKIYNGSNWIYKDKDETINDLMDGKYFILDTFYDDNCDNLTRHNRFNYEKFRHYFDDKDKKVFTQIMNECELLFLNNR